MRAASKAPWAFRLRWIKQLTGNRRAGESFDWIAEVVADWRTDYSEAQSSKVAQMAEVGSPGPALKPIDSLEVDVVTDDVSDTYVSKTLFAISEFANVVMAGAKVISGETLLCANLGLGLRLISKAGDLRHTLLFDTGPEGAIFLRNCANLGIHLGDVECIAVSHGHWDHMAALPGAIDAIVKEGGEVTVHVNPGMFNERAIRLASGTIVPVANVPLPTEMEARGAKVVNRPDARLLLDGHFY
jgi:7,8-dihydropterin-6-yl-methyl-4-(beta-D-ribofuranosyl)aminobenzene 5'-phosphate synthase